jgi:hypothetical protein
MAYANPQETWADVTVSVAGQSGSTRVILTEFNHCGRQIAYVPLQVAPEHAISFGEVTYISPCQLLE